MTKIQMLQKVAYLEFVQDQLSTELSYTDTLLRSVGFPEGLQSAKQVAYEMLNQDSE